MSKLKVLYITGCSRSGTTIVDNILGQIPGFFSAGEVNYLWSRGLLQGGRCGCGRPIRDCPVWKKVLAAPHGDRSIGDIEPRHIVEFQKTNLRVRHTWRVLRSNVPRSRLAGYGSLLKRLYCAIADVTGADVVVDSSKRPAEAALLAKLDGLDTYVVHMVRDPRAVAYSWQRHKHQPGFGDDRSMLVHPASWSTAHWVVWNAAATAIRRGRSKTMLMRYEDFVAEPRSTIERAIGFVRQAPAALPFLDDHTVWLEPTHTVSGNPSRFETGRVQIRLDTEWMHSQSATDRLVATTISLPSIHRYGYPVRLSQAPVPGGK